MFACWVFIVIQLICDTAEASRSLSHELGSDGACLVPKLSAARTKEVFF